MATVGTSDKQLLWFKNASYYTFITSDFKRVSLESHGQCIETSEGRT